MALDFTLPPELRELVDRVRAYVEQDALPAEAEIADPADVQGSWHVVERLRDRARERGLLRRICRRNGVGSASARSGER